MTVITYRNGIMAADKGGRTNDCIRNNVRKIYKCPINKHLYGFSGHADSMSDFIEYVVSDDSNKANNAYSSRKIPKDHNGEYSKFIVLVAQFKTGSVQLLTAFGTEDYTDESYVAVGAGAEVAYGAMYAGASAVDAVHAAIAHSAYCRGTVFSRELFE